VLQLNLANALLQGGQPEEAATILNRYTFTYKEDGNGWDLLAQAEGALGNRDQELAARAEAWRWSVSWNRRFPCSAAPARR
jgi:predicted Zn-dependent protease